MKQVINYSEFAENMFGKLKPEIIKRISKFLNNPTTAGWEDIHGIIISASGKMKTVWQAVRDVDPFFPSYGRKTDSAGNVIRDWDETPTPEIVIEAIKKTVLNKFIQHKN